MGTLVYSSDSLPPNVPQILINREPLRHLNFDVELLGDCDVIVNELCHRLGQSWQSLCTKTGPSQEVSRSEMVTPQSSTRPSPAGRQQNEESLFHLNEEDLIQNLETDSTRITSSPPAQELRPNSLEVPHKGMVTKDSSSSLCAMVSHLTTDQMDPTISNDSTGSLCAMVGDMSTDRDLESELESVSTPFPCTDLGSEHPEDANRLPFGTTDLGENHSSEGQQGDPLAPKEDVNSGAGGETISPREGPSEENMEEIEKAQEEINDLEDLRACWEPKVYNLASRLKGQKTSKLIPFGKIINYKKSL